MDLDQVRGYIRDDKVRADVMRHILDFLPSYGDIVLIAHSLGSVMIDLLDHPPEGCRYDGSSQSAAWPTTPCTRAASAC
jgi:hypothetical protein